MRVDSKRGPDDCQCGEGHLDSSLFSVEFFSLTYSYFSTFTTDDTICSEAQLYHKAICYFTNIEIGRAVSRKNSH